MGQKVHPKIFRIGVIHAWPSRWFARTRNYPKMLKDDVALRELLAKELKDASVDRVEIERPSGGMTIAVYSAKPGVIIGRGGQGIEELRRKIKAAFPKVAMITVNVHEVDQPSLSASIVARAMIADIEKRMSYRRILKQSLDRVRKAGALGAKVRLSGRLDGAEIARQETLAFGKIPLHTLRADINYAFHEAQTLYGKIGVKVWIYRGDIFEKKKEEVKS